MKPLGVMLEYGHGWVVLRHLLSYEQMWYTMKNVANELQKLSLISRTELTNKHSCQSLQFLMKLRSFTLRHMVLEGTLVEIGGWWVSRGEGLSAIIGAKTPHGNTLRDLV
eukprot:2684126-Amphidinium_carterae.1